MSAAKILVDFAKENESLVIKAGSYNKSQIDKAEIINISKMPSLDEIRAKLISLIQTLLRDSLCITSSSCSVC